MEGAAEIVAAAVEKIFTDFVPHDRLQRAIALVRAKAPRTIEEPIR